MSSVPAPENAIRDIRELHISEQNVAQDDRPNLVGGTVRANHRARDITNEFTEASHDLKTGELVKEESFTLWDSVQALELMDPKMDSGFVPEGEPFDSGFDIHQNLLPEEVVYIMDQLLGCETAWQRGFAMFQTLLTSCHIHHLLTQRRDPKTLPSFGMEQSEGLTDHQAWLHLCLRAFCINTIIQCDMVIEIVASQQYYEEEDLNTQTYQIELLTDITDEMSIGLLDSSIAWIQERRMTEIEAAILHRLQLRRATMLRSILDQGSMHLEELKTVLKVVKESHHHARSIEAAFNPKMYRKLSISGPTREARALPLDDACGDLDEFLGCIAEQHRGLSNHITVRNPASLQAFLWQMAFRKPHAGPLARAILQARLFAPDCSLGTVEGVRLYMLRELSTLQILPDDMIDGSYYPGEEAPSHPKVQMMEILDQWIEQYQSVYIDILHALCQNPCRIRRCLVNALGSLNAIAVSDTTIPPPSLSLPKSTTPITELAAHLLRLKTLSSTNSLKIHILHLGLTHSLHAPHELPSIYHQLQKAYTTSLESITHLFHLLTACSKNNAFLSIAIPRADFMQSMNRRRAMLDARAKYLRTMTAAATAFSKIYTALLHCGLLPQGPTSATLSKRQRDLRSRDWNPSLPVSASQAVNDIASQTSYDMQTDLKLADESLSTARVGLQEMLEMKQSHIWEELGLDGERRWAADAKRVLRAVVEMRIVVLRKLVESDGLIGGSGVKVKVPEDVGGGSWGCWVVPKLNSVVAP